MQRNYQSKCRMIKRKITLNPIYKKKGNIPNCTHYRRIKLMNHNMKFKERVIERIPRKKTQDTDNQFSFMSGRSTIEAIYLL